tara:strand:- start:235 stop:399 length:165 start_codon:yes stop_codon:yes gene_type:complete
MRTFEVKLEVTETHYVKVQAKSKSEAEEIAEDMGVNSLDAHETDVEAVGVVEVK